MGFAPKYSRFLWLESDCEVVDDRLAGALHVGDEIDRTHRDSSDLFLHESAHDDRGLLRMELRATSSRPPYKVFVLARPFHMKRG